MPPRKLLSRPRRLSSALEDKVLVPSRLFAEYWPRPAHNQNMRSRMSGMRPVHPPRSGPFFWDKFTLSSLFVLQGTHHKRLTKTKPKEIHSEKARKALVLVQYQAKNGGEMARKWARISFFHACWPVLQGKSSRKSSSGEQPKRSCTSADPSLQRALDASHGATIPVP